MPTARLQHKALAGHISRLWIAIDPGTGFLKASFKVQVHGESSKLRLGVDRGILSSVHVLTWPNGFHELPTQIAYVRRDPSDGGIGQPAYEQIWGDVIADAKDTGRPIIGDPFRWLKPALFGDTATQASHKERIDSQIDGLPETIRYSARDSVNPELRRKLTCLDLYSDFLGHAWRYILRKIKESNSSLPWPSWTPEDPDAQYVLPSYPPVEVAIPLPANTKPHHVDFLLRAARRAGIRDPFPVAEPAAAFAYDIQSAKEPGAALPQNACTLVVDVGCGSADVQLWSILQTNPIGVREEVEGVDGWCGGQIVNETIRGILRRKCNLENVWHKIRTELERIHRPRSLEGFLDDACAQFESRKITFGSHRLSRLILEVPGVPEIALAQMKQNQIHLNEEELRQAFDASFTPIKAMIDAMIGKFQENRSPGDPIQKIHKMLLIGGGSASPYLNNRIRDEYERRGSWEMQTSIPVNSRNDDRHGATSCIVQGAILLLLDKAFLRERVIRRGYCVRVDEETERKVFSHLNFQVERDPHDGRWSRVEVSRFLIRSGERIGHYHRAVGPGGCWRGLFLDELKPHGWDLEEEIFYSDTTSKDGLWVNSECNDIHPCGKLLFSLKEEDCADFELCTSTVNLAKPRPYKRLEYRIDFIIDGIRMTYQISIPRNGRLEGKDKQGLGRNPIRKLGVLDCSGSFELFNSV